MTLSQWRMPHATLTDCSFVFCSIRCRHKRSCTALVGCASPCWDVSSAAAPPCDVHPALMPFVLAANISGPLAGLASRACLPCSELQPAAASSAVGPCCLCCGWLRWSLALAASSTRLTAGSAPLSSLPPHSNTNPHQVIAMLIHCNTAGINSCLDEVMQRVPRHPDYNAVRMQQRCATLSSSTTTMQH